MHVTIHTDGGSRGNPGKSAIGIVIESEGTSLFEKGLYVGIGTNNRAEYLAAGRCAGSSQAAKLATGYISLSHSIL